MVYHATINAFTFYLDSTNLGIGALLRSSVVTKQMLHVSRL